MTLLIRSLGKAAQGLEATFTAGWSLGEMVYAIRRPGRILRDPYRQLVLDDIQQHGLYKTPPPDPPPTVKLRKGGWISLPNPYQRLDEAGPDRIVARLLRHKGRRQRRLLVCCHCYALPLPRLMERYFGLHDLHGYDVVYNIMNHHYRGSFRLWPGFGLANPRMSHMIESMRSSITGLRTLIESLTGTFGYESASVLGYSIGGQLALHVANCHPVSNLIAYCPVVSLRDTAAGLGLMSVASPGIERGFKRIRPDFSLDDLNILDPLQHKPLIHPSRVLVVAQTRDAMVPYPQLLPLKDAYPGAEWYEFPGTHVYTAHGNRLRNLIRDKLDAI